MDRSTLYDQALGREFDVLSQAKDMLSALTGLAADLCGSTTNAVVTGLSALQSNPPSLTINIGPGRIYQNASIDTTAWSVLPVDNTTIFQQGFAAAQNVTLTTTGLNSGQSQWVLLEAQFAQVDLVRTSDPNNGILPFWNSAAPTQPLNGQGNSGQPLPTVRKGTVSVRAVYGTAATSGAEVPPNVDNGWVPLYLIDLAFNQGQILQNQILASGPSVGVNVPSNYPSAPFLAGLLNSHHNGTIGQAPKIQLTSAAEVQGLLPMANLIASNTIGAVSSWRNVTGNPNGNLAGNSGVNGSNDVAWDTVNKIFYVCTTTGNAATAVWTGINTVNTTAVYVGGTSTGSANAQVVTPLSPAGYSLTAGYIVNFQAGFTNTGSTTLNAQSTGAITIQKSTTGGLVNLSGGEIIANNFISCLYNGTVYVLQGPALGLLAFMNPGLYTKNDGSGNLTLNLSTIAVGTGIVAPPLGNDGTNKLTILPVITPGTYVNVTVAQTGQVVAGLLAAGSQPSITVLGNQVNPFTAASGTYTTPTGAIRLFIRMIAGGGAGGLSKDPNGVNGGNGGTTSFGSVTAAGGGGGTGNQTGTPKTPGIGGPGGTGGTGTASLRIPGANGSDGFAQFGGVTIAFPGAASYFGANPVSSVQTAWAPGSGGPVLSGNATGAAFQSAGAGGAGEYVEFSINTPAATYSYVAGAGGSPPAGGTTFGGNGIIIVTAFFY